MFRSLDDDVLAMMDDGEGGSDDCRHGSIQNSPKYRNT